ncbi:MAG TPA: amino acid adenylation domain-containing protein, partial [Candidatus Angelobacter sp.]|nr:amino acid adenylation domain-containing protein [Candidatus Angelobacter sp.]
ANRLARKLRELGAGQGSPVGICMERSLEMVIGLVAILKSGAAYVPLDPGYPSERLAYMIADAQASVLLVQQKLLANLPQWHARVLAVDSDWNDHISALEASNLNLRIDGADLAYVIYTSGSTGKPKAAMNTHYGIRNRLLWGQEKYQLVNSDKVLQKTPFSFDVSVWEFFWPLTSGAQLVLAKPGGHQDSSYLVDLIRSQGITTVHFVPSMLQAFLDENGLEHCTTVKRVVCSGEAMSLELKERFFTRFGCELHNLYGPTEASVEVTWWECRPNDGLRTVPIGRPIANTRMYVLDGEMRPVPIGVPGDLYIGGTAVGRGYWRRPALTAANFVPDPFSSGGQRLYRTGDIARYRADGWIEYMGRSDHQVKIRGFRIELGEIEETLLSQKGVKDVAVLARDDNSQAKRLVAYVVLDQEAFAEGEDSSAKLKAALKEKLPPYMVPSAFVCLESLPLLPNGKLDRKALPAPEFDLLPRNVYLRPRDTLELQLIAIWEDILSVQPIGIRDDFFDLGGHSLKAVQLAARIRQDFGQQVPIAFFLHNSTVEDLAALLRTRIKEPVRQALVPVKTRGNRKPFFCVHPVGGNVLCYAGLARHLSPTQPFYTLQSNDEIEAESIEAMASQYVECIRSIQTEGPYLLGGWSMGGVVAFEMGRQLLQEGESADIYLIDTAAPNHQTSSWVPDDALLISYFVKDLESITGRPLDIDPESLQALPQGAALGLLFEKVRGLSIIPEQAPYEELVKLFYKFRKNLRALLTYNAEPYAGRVTLIKSSGTTGDDNDPSLGWAAFAQGQFGIHEIEGDHYSIVTGAQVQELASLLEQKFSAYDDRAVAERHSEAGGIDD